MGQICDASNRNSLRVRPASRIQHPPCSVRRASVLHAVRPVAVTTKGPLHALAVPHLPLPVIASFPPFAEPEGPTRPPAHRASGCVVPTRVPTTRLDPTLACVPKIELEAQALWVHASARRSSSSSRGWRWPDSSALDAEMTFRRRRKKYQDKVKRREQNREKG